VSFAQKLQIYHVLSYFMMRLTKKTTIFKISWLFLLKKPYHLCLENSILKEVKIAHILKTIQLFDSIFSPDVIFPPWLSITTQKNTKNA
jgi:hypothetical protein